MATNVQSNRQVCATCQFWTGERRIIQSGRIVETPTNEHKPCTAGKGNYMGAINGGPSCKSYRRWVELP